MAEQSYDDFFDQGASQSNKISDIVEVNSTQPLEQTGQSQHQVDIIVKN